MVAANGILLHPRQLNSEGREKLNQLATSPLATRRTPSTKGTPSPATTAYGTCYSTAHGTGYSIQHTALATASSTLHTAPATALGISLAKNDIGIEGSKGPDPRSTFDHLPDNIKIR